jgi:AAA domain
VRHEGRAESTRLPTQRVGEIEQTDGTEHWLVRSLWSEQAVGFIGGAPKSCKSWFGLDLAVSIASGTACLDRFEVQTQGPALVYLAEDSLEQVRRRIEGLCRHRHLDIAQLDLHVITASSLRLDLESDQLRLATTLRELRPRLLLLDPLVRMHRIDENSSADISRLLGLLRELQREHAVAIAVVHHMSKRTRAQLGQALRGSTDLHAWSDSSAYLVRRRGRLVLSLEHRSAAAPEPLGVALVGDEEHTHLEIRAPEADENDLDPGPPSPLTHQLCQLLEGASQPMTRGALRAALRVNNQRLGDALKELERQRIIERVSGRWALRTATNHTSRQLTP